MTRVCFVGDDDVVLRYELLSRETSREALSTYDLHRPFENSIAVDTVSLGAAISLCNDLQWYVVRFVDEVLIQEPSVHESEWLSRELAGALRREEITPDETGEFLKIFGLERPEPDGPSQSTDGPSATVGGPMGSNTDRTDANPGDADSASMGGAGADSGTGDPVDDGSDSDPATDESTAPGRLVEPLYVRRADGDVPEYDLRDVEDTVVVRLTEAEYAP